MSLSFLFGAFVGRAILPADGLSSPSSRLERRLQAALSAARQGKIAKYPPHQNSFFEDSYDIGHDLSVFRMLRGSAPARIGPRRPERAVSKYRGIAPIGCPAQPEPPGSLPTTIARNPKIIRHESPTHAQHVRYPFARYTKSTSSETDTLHLPLYPELKSQTGCAW